MYGDLQHSPPGVDRFSAAASMYGKQRFDEALVVLEPLLVAQPVDVQVLNLAAAWCLSMDRLLEAEAHWRHAIGAKPDYCDAHNNLGVTLKELGRLAEAEACYRQALSISPEHAGAHVNMGRLFAQLGRPEAAEAAYLREIELQPRDCASHLNLGVLYQDQMRLPEAESAYRNAIAANTN